MQSRSLLWLFAALLMIPAPPASSQSNSPMQRTSKTRVSLQSGWQFREAGGDSWHAATVPGCVHTDLLANKLIEDPFYRDNEKTLQWIGKTDWEYQTTFKVAPQTLKQEHVELVFEGLDTYAEVFFNDTSLLRADNMFRTWRVDCRRALKTGNNVLRIRFRSPINEVLPLMAKLNYQLPAPNDQGEKTSPYTRKAPYHYGWDWGPRFVTSGIWKPVFLEAWNDARLADVHLVQKRVDQDAAELTAEIEIVAARELEAELIVDNVNGKAVAARRSVKLISGSNLVTLDFAIQHPSLWWPNGIGPHPVYEFRARLLIQGKLVDQASTRTGLRSLELKREADKWGQSFAFVINGVPVFAKGGNWIPADSFPSRISKKRYRQLIQSVRDANMNMLRVWGGGIYESDDFYNLCDEMGILVWQEFMFSGSMYPGDQEFLDNVRAEAVDNVKRLRNHPSIVIWSGNNEIEAGWFNWGWKSNLPATLWDDYQKIFAGVLKETCATLDPSRPYWPSSPHGGLDGDPNSLKSGDTHSWKVWHFAAPFHDYEKEFPRFMSEYGFQSFPQIESVNAYTLPAERDIQSPVMMAHQRHPRGNQLIREYMLRDYPAPKDFESFLYVSQVLQAEGIKIGAEHLRRIMPRNMGSLYWQIDDCWPVASWSSIDYYGRWKALQYYARRFYTSLLVSPVVEKDNLNFCVVSDKTQASPAKLNIVLLGFDGHALLTVNKDISVAALASQSYFSMPISSLLQNRDSRNLMIYCELTVDGKTVSSNEYFFAPYKDLSVPRATIATEVVPIRNGFRVTLSADKFAKDVYLSVTDHDGFFSDNYLDLIPGKPLTVEYHSGVPISLQYFRERLKVRSLTDAF